ncbi:MAG TPA: DNA primase [Candidatus Woesebacteria bacterium]|nr:DNA primase [Candidatus Woesebacteria bacterium]HPR99888.1 DNA primase [Candidatus Woesebacteria bacterium]
MENQVEEIKKKLDIVEVINKFVPLKKRGRHYVACCPFHQEKTPSFVVSPELQIYKCFGCGKAGDVFTFVQEYNRIDFKDALEDLAKMAGIKLVRSTKISGEESIKKRLFEINRETAKFYNYILLKHELGKEALEYIKKRNISEETINKFLIGFAPPDGRLIINYLLKKGYKTEELYKTGSFGKSQYKQGQSYDRFSDRLIFPQIDFRDRIVGFSGRILPSNKNQNLAKYINSPETEIYHKSQMFYGLNLAKESIKKNNLAIIVEGELDMISPYQAGIENVVAIKGTALTEEQLQLIRRYAETLILGLDSDFAGNKAMIRSIELADKMDFEIKILDLEEKYKDPDEAINKDLDFFKKKLNEAETIWDFILASSVKNYGIDSPRGKKLILATVLPFLAKINNLVIRADYIKKVSQTIDSDEESVAEEFKKYLNQNKESISNLKKINKIEEKGDMRERLEERYLILALRLQKPKIAIKLLKWKTPRFIKIGEVIEKITKFEAKKVAENLDPELLDTFNNLYLKAFEDPNSAEERRKERSKILRQIKELELRDRLKSLSDIIANLEASGDENEIAKVEANYAQILTKLAILQRAKS